jgi:hypothetical protein
MSVFPGVNSFVQNYAATATRRVKPFILAAIHITDNFSLMSAMNEAIYSNRWGSGASFTFVNNRNGTTVQCLHPEWQVPFTNGSWRNSNRSLWTVNYAINNLYGANDSTFMTIENVGCEGIGAPITNEQVEKCAQLIAYGSRLTGIPVNRATVLGHRDYDAVERYNCPTRYDLNYLLYRIINRANQLLAPAPAPAPTPAPAPAGVPNVLLRQVQQDWITKNGGEFWTGGPGMGEKKYFGNGVRIRSHFEEVAWFGRAPNRYLSSNKWRVISYNGEGLWIHRSFIDPVANTRIPATGYGPA